MTYLRLRSWHILAVVEAQGWKTRCGFHVNEDAEVAYILPLGQKTCENCLRLTLKDEEATVENDPILSEVDSPEGALPS